MIRTWLGSALRLAGLSSLLAVSAIRLSAGVSHAAAVPQFTSGYWNIVARQGTTLTVRDTRGTTLVVAVAPSASLHHRFYGVFPVGDLAQIKTRDLVQLGDHRTGPGTATAYLLQDYSLQVAHTEVKGAVISVAANHTRFTLRLTVIYGGTDAAFSVGQRIIVQTPNPTSVPVSYLQGGPTCGNASCMTAGLTLELYGLSDQPHQLIEQPQGVSQVATNAPQLVHAATDSSN